ncbi:hypothetical protein BH10ACT7_BH10ACT7_12190 [soil metagenome]
MGFSLAGLLLSVVILAPSILLIAFMPRDMPKHVPSGGWLLTGLERAGQAATLVVPAITGNDGRFSWWMIAVILFVLGYYALWLRYFLGGRQFADLYRPAGPLPVPMAILPVLAFGAGALWLQSAWLGLATLVLAVGHIGTSLVVARFTAAGEPAPREG